MLHLFLPLANTQQSRDTDGRKSPFCIDLNYLMFWRATEIKKA